MQARTVERVESWDARPFSGGVDQLHELADADFSGAVSAGGTWLFLLNGRVIGVFEGEVEDVTDAADGTVYEAPHESVALLYSMQERGGETQAKYYTNDTPLSEASETLSDAKFTGYIELSENVLSGDYYVVYYGGRSMSAAFVGTSEELVTGDEAFERADDEVGVYEVVKTPVNVTELPPREDSGGGDDETAAAGGGGGAGAASGAAAGAADDASAGSGAGDGADARGTDASLSTGSESAGGSTADAAGGPDAGEASADEAPADAGGQSAASDRASARRSSDGDRDDDDDGSGDDSAGRSRQRARSRAESSNSSGSDAGSSGTGAAAEAGGTKTTTTTKAAASESEQAFDDEREWRKTTSVPTIDPDDSASGGDGSQSGSGGSGGSRTKAPSSSTSSSSSTTKSRSSRSRSSSPSSSSSGAKSTVEKLKQAVKQREQKLQAASERIDDLEDERDDLEAERDRLEERVESLESERDELESTVEDLESELAAAEASGGSDGGDPAARDLNPVDALSGTNLFVRYDSKGAPTLDELKDTTDPAAVNENLRIDHHTQFDAGSATVNGEAFESFLPETTVHRFVSWAVRALPYEVRDSGHKSGLADLYDALPRVDRAELNGTVEVNPDEDTTVSRTFDVVLRDRMGNPLVVADVSTGRDPVTGDQMGALVEDATAIREGTDDLAAAMYVTGSFFEPAALETADEATAAGGLFSRSDRESFVKVGRKAGYHLCLVEDRNDAFHLTVPEL